MKVWQKIYLVVLCISVLFVNMGIYAVFQTTYQKNIETEQVRGEVDYTVISKNIQKSMQAMDEQGRLTREAAADLIKIYEEDHAKQEMQIKLWKNQVQLYPKKWEKIPYPTTETQTRITIRGKRQKKELVVVSAWKLDQDVYYLYMNYPLKELNATWNQLHRIYLVVSFGISLVLAFSLYLMLRFLLRPLKRLEEHVLAIREGDYSSRIEMRGDDEFARLGENINAMADTIETTMHRLQEDSQKKEQLVDNLAHEMKSPLTSIYGFAEYLMKGRVEPEEAIECYSYIMEESQRMKDMCYVLMDLSEIRNKQITFSDFSAKEFVAGLEMLANRRQSECLETEKVSIRWNNLMPEGQKIYGNRNLLEMLVWNLLSNAIRSCLHKREETQEQVGIVVWMESGRETERSIHLRVCDEGIGIPKEKLKHITEPFYRVDKGRSREQGGNGLGLALCRQIVDLHHGTMTFSSVVDQGTAVSIQLWES